MANNLSIFDRLVGLETEYAIRFRPTDVLAPRPTRFRQYQSVIDALGRRLPTVAARHFKEGVFTATGGAVWFEAERPAAGGGLLEGSTPECRGPRQLLAYQRAQDRLLGECAKASGLAGQLCLVKNDRDAFNNVYGAQENYEARLTATPLGLWCWRIGLVSLLPLLLVTWIGFLAVILILTLYLALAGMVYLVIHRLSPDSRRLALAMFGRDLVEGRETGCPTPAWLEWLVLGTMRVITAPLAAGLLALVHLVAFRRLRGGLTPLLASRCVIAGAGMVDENGQFQLADKAPAINCMVGFGGFLNDRPLFTMGHFFKALCLEACVSPRDFFELFADRQRLQIGLGDSNMAETAELLRVGTTLLVIDAIEAGCLPNPPRLRKPVRAMRTFCADSSLRATVRLESGQRVTAIELQRIYVEACRRFLSRYSNEAPDEAYEVLHRWEDELEALEELRVTGTAPPGLVGSIDWVTKKFLLEQAGADVSWKAQKKIDIRYHELSPDGYFNLIRDAGMSTPIVSSTEIERAMRTAPPDTPATTRGHYIREFSSDAADLTVNWKHIRWGRGWKSKIVRLSKYNRRRSPPPRGRSGVLK